MNRSLLLDNRSNISQFIIRYQEQKNKVSNMVSSEQSLPKSRKKRSRNRQISCQGSNGKGREQKQVPVLSLHTNADQKKEEREYSRVPIEYMDERDSGNPADRVRGRVVYRGYTPKNTFYYFKTIKDIKYGGVSIKQKDKDYRGQDLVFNSKFQSGNLNAAVRVSNRQYWLFMREDTNTHGLRQWFFFEVKSRKAGKFKFRVYKYSKRFSLYKHGMKPFVRSQAPDSEWHQQGEKVGYQYDETMKCFYLEFQFIFQEHKMMYFASLPPYTYSKLNCWLESIGVEEMVSIRKVGMSLGGLDIMSIIINDKQRKMKDMECKSFSLPNAQKLQSKMRDTVRESPVLKQKEAIIVLARTHPGETVSNWALQSFVGRVLQTSQLTDNFIFYIIPMVNPDGVFLGNHRTGVLGLDLNRNFHNSDLEYFPQIQSIQQLISTVNRKHKIAFMFDLHGHSAKRNIFAFGEECQIGSQRYYKSRIIPKILDDTLSSFKFQSCLFRGSKEKNNTARVFFSSKYGINAVTFQESYGLLDQGCIEVGHWRNFGVALADSLAVYAQFGKEGRVQNIKRYLQGLVKEQRQAIKRRKERERQRQLERQRVAELQRQKQRQKQKEQLKNRLAIKTQGASDESSKPTQPKHITQMLKKMKLKTPRILQNIEQQSEKIMTPTSTQQQQQQQQDELSSGDEQLQIKPQELQVMKKEIFKIGVINRQITRRQLYSMADKKVQLSQNHEYADFSARLHQKQSPVVQRIFKFKNKQRSRDMQVVTFVGRKGNSIQLPYIKK